MDTFLDNALMLFHVVLRLALLLVFALKLRGAPVAMLVGVGSCLLFLGGQLAWYVLPRAGVAFEVIENLNSGAYLLGNILLVVAVALIPVARAGDAPLAPRPPAMHR